MDKKVRRICLLSIAVVIFACLSSACGENPVRLDTPCNFVFENRIVSWDKVENAVKYAVFFEGKEYEVQDNKFNTLDVTIEEKEYAIEVIAVGDEKDYVDSEWGTFNFEITAPIEYGFDEDGLFYTLLDDRRGYAVTRGTVDLTGVIKIPEYFSELPVTTIADEAFYLGSPDVASDPFTESACNTQTTGVILPSTLNSIGKLSFSCMVRLSEISIPDSVTSIGMRAFDGCSHLEKVVLPKNLKVIPSECFANCALKEVVLPDGLEKIGAYAFRCQTKSGDNNPELLIKHTEQNFTKIVIPDSVKEIGTSAFSGCKMLKDVTLSKSIETIGVRIFSDTAWYDSKPDGMVVIGDVLYGYKGDVAGGTLVVPDGVRIIASGALEQHDELERVIFPESLTTISDRSFSLCALYEVVLPNGLQVVDKAAFGGCQNLESVVIPKSSMNFSEKAMTACKSLTKVFFYGKEDEWNRFKNQNELTETTAFPYATIYYYSETKPIGEGNYWHYVDGEVTKW